MQKNERAIAVAEDVLKHLNVLKLQTGTYMFGEKWRLLADDEAGDLQAYADAATEDCQVCLLGACLLSKARLFNAVPLREVTCMTDEGRRFSVGNYMTYSHLQTVFDTPSLELMESAFEGRNFASYENWDEGLLAAKYGQRFPSRRDCVEAVMQEVIRQGGRFRPSLIKKEISITTETGA